MKLSELLKNVENSGFARDVEVLDVTQDSRQVKEGSLFVCIAGDNFDGRKVAEEMLEKGAAAVVTDCDLGLFNQIIVENTRNAYSLICANL